MNTAKTKGYTGEKSVLCVKPGQKFSIEHGSGESRIRATFMRVADPERDHEANLTRPSSTVAAILLNDGEGREGFTLVRLPVRTDAEVLSSDPEEDGHAVCQTCAHPRFAHEGKTCHGLISGYAICSCKGFDS